MIEVGLVFAQEQDSGEYGAATAAFLLGLYVIPSVIAVARKMPNVGSIIVVNVLLGWTIIGWIVALAMALGSSQRRGVTVNVINNSVGPPDWSPAPARLQSARESKRAAAPAGRWAEDPYSTARLRYHDGKCWTEHVSDGDGQRRSHPAEFPAPDSGEGWASDPFGRYALRYFDGTQWTQNVLNESRASRLDTPGFPAPRKVEPRAAPPPTAPPVPPPPRL